MRLFHHFLRHTTKNITDVSQGPSWGSKLGSKFLPWGSLCERTPLGKVLGNLAQAKTGSTQDPFVLKCYVMYLNLSPFVSTVVTV